MTNKIDTETKNLIDRILMTQAKTQEEVEREELINSSVMPLPVIERDYSSKEYSTP